MRRGSDALTTREREVLDLIHVGLTNEEIAGRLGITLDGAKYHVSQILSKLGVATREEAAALALGERRRGWAGWQLWARIAGAATTAVAIGGLALLAWGVLRTGAPTEAQRPQRTTVSADFIPWSEIPAANVAEPLTIPGVPACQAADLAVRQVDLWGLIVHNIEATPCFVGSALEVTFVTTDGKIVMPAERTGGDIVYLSPPRGYLQGLATPPPGFSDIAGGAISIHSCYLPADTEIEISPGRGLGVLTLDTGPSGGWGTPCPDEAQSYLAHLSGEDCCSGGGSRTETRIDVPAVTRPGDRLRFVVTITNDPGVTSGTPPLPGEAYEPPPTPPPLEWSPCPTYHQELQGVPGSFHTYRLSCEPVAPLAPKASATFEMFIDVPGNAQPGPTVLEWGLDGAEGMYYDASINVWIEP